MIINDIDKEECFHLGAKAIIRNVDREILLLKRMGRSQEIFWDLPGGRLQKKESLTVALKRELKEEIGLETFQELKPFTMFLTDIRIPIADKEVGLIFSMFILNVLDFVPQLSTEHLDYAWFSSTQIPGKLYQYPEEILKKIASLDESFL